MQTHISETAAKNLDWQLEWLLLIGVKLQKIPNLLSTQQSKDIT
jgi:hypothetical protein